jgi:hypothetical protein
MPHPTNLDSTYLSALFHISSKGFNDIYNLDTLELSEDYIYQNLSNDPILSFEELLWKEIETSKPKIDIPDSSVVDIIKLIDNDLHPLNSQGMKTNYKIFAVIIYS